MLSYHVCLFFILIGRESKANYDANPAVSQPQPVGDQYCTGLAPFAAYSAATIPDVSANALIEEFATNLDPSSRA